MLERYGWKREYKGAHARGNLTTAEYKVERAKERLAEVKEGTRTSLRMYANRVRELTGQLEDAVSVNWEEAKERDVILQYLMACPEEYEEVLRKAQDFLESLPKQEHAVAYKSLNDIVCAAQQKAVEQKAEHENELYLR